MKLFTKKASKENIVEQILLENYDQYYRLAYSYVQNEADAGDIVQNGAYQAIRNSAKLKNEEFAATWVYRIMLNEIFKFYKQHKNESLDHIALEEQGKEDVYQNIDLQNAMNSLDAEEKAIIQLRYFEEYKIEEIAEILNQNVSTVKSKLYRSMKKLRLTLADSEETIEEGGALYVK